MLSFVKNSRKINFPILAKVMGWLIMIEGGFMAIPAIVALALGEVDWQALAIATAITVASGFCLNRFIRPASHAMAKREGFLLTAMVWIVFSVFGMLPFMLCSHPLGLTDAFFEAMAGFTTTGCTPYANVDALGCGINLWRALMQWLGGMGIILFTLAVLPMLNHSGGMQMFNAEVTGITHEKVRPRISSTAKMLWGVYFAFTVACALLLWAGPMTLFESICHAMGTLSTGGFSTRTAGIASWHSDYVYAVITFFMFVGGTNFSLLAFACMRRFKPIRENVTMRAYLCIVLLCTLAFVFAVWRSGGQGWADYTLYPLFQVVATVTSTGYSTPQLAEWGALAAMLLVPMMFFGACAGSTSGGAKIDRLLVLLIYLKNSLKRALQPNNITSVKIDGKVMSTDLVSKTIAFICLFAAIALASSIVLAATGTSPQDSFYASLACITNLGIGTDNIGLGEGFALLPAVDKWMLAGVMLIGRLEVYTMLIIFTPAFWHK